MARKLFAVPRPRVVEQRRKYHECSCCGRTRLTTPLEVRASWRHPWSGVAVELLPGARVCSICVTGLKIHPSPEHVGPGSFAELDRRAEENARVAEKFGGRALPVDLPEGPRVRPARLA